MPISSLELQHFFPVELSIRAVEETPELVIIHLKSQSKTCTCPGCGCVLHRKHSTYRRRVHDLPIWGKNVELQISAYAYACEEAACSTVSVNETFGGFLGEYSRMTTVVRILLSVWRWKPVVRVPPVFFTKWAFAPAATVSFACY